MSHCPECSAQIIITDENCPVCNFPVAKLRGLCAATLTQDAEMVAALIQMGADVNSIDQNGRTPLMIAAFVGNVDIVEMLLAAGANPEFTNDAGESALTLAQTKDVERLLRRAIVVLKFSAARKKETEETFAVEQDKVEEVPAEEITPDIEEALSHLEPVVEAPRLTLESTQPIPESSEESYKQYVPAMNFDSTQQFISLDSTQPIPITFKELEIEEEEEEEEEEQESFTELSADLEEDPLAGDIDQFIQTELQDVQPVMRVESSNKYNSPTLDPVEESLTENPEEQRTSKGINEFIQAELEDVQPSFYFEPRPNEPSFTLDPMEFLMEPPAATSNETREDVLLQDELYDVQPSIRSETRLVERSLTLDPMEQLLMELPVSAEESKQDEYLQSELQATEHFYETATADSLLESLDPTEQMLEESEQIPEPVIEEPANVVTEPQPVLIEPEPVVIEPEPVLVEPEPVVIEREPVAIEPDPVVIEPAPVPRELQRWEDWNQVEHAVAFAPWKIESDSSDYESNDPIELAQPIEELIAPTPTPEPVQEFPEVPPQIFMNSRRTRNIAIGVGVAIFFVQILLFMNWQLGSRKSTQQTKVVQAPIKQTPSVAPTPKPESAKPQPKVEIKKETVVPTPTPTPTPAAVPAPKKPESKVIAATRSVPQESSKKQAMIKYESKEKEPEPVPFKAVRMSSPANVEKSAKARELNDQGSDLLRAGKVSEGISLLEQAVHSFPKGTSDENYASALLNLGRAWRMAGRPDISIRLLEQRMKINIERDEVERELTAAKRQAVESGMGIRND